MKKILGWMEVGVKVVLAGICLVVGLTMLTSGLINMLDPVEQYQSIKDLPVYELADANANSPKKKDPLIAIFKENKRTKQWEFDCTAFVISDKLAITAGHCVVDPYSERMLKEEFVMKDKGQQEIGKVKPGAVNIRADLAVLVGDFSKFNKFHVNPDGFYGSTGPYLAVGFPWGQTDPVQLPFYPKANYFFLIKGEGQLYPGMSGGPIYDVGTHQVVGVSVQADDGFVAVVPTIGLTGALELRVKSP